MQQVIGNAHQAPDSKRLAYSLARVTGEMMQIDRQGVSVLVPRGPCKLYVGRHSTVLRWGNSMAEATTFDNACLEMYIALGMIERRRVSRS